MSAEKVRRYLMENGVRYETHTHPTAYTTVETATAGHVPCKQMAKVVLLDVDDRLVMAVVPGDRMVDFDKTASLLDAAHVDLAGEQEFAVAFPDCEAGAEPPFGTLYDIPMVVDEGIETENITFAAGTHQETMTVALADYLSLTHPQRGDLTA